MYNIFIPINWINRGLSLTSGCYLFLASLQCFIVNQKLLLYLRGHRNRIQENQGDANNYPNQEACVATCALQITTNLLCAGILFYKGKLK